MSGLDPLAPGAPVLVAGGGVTGKAVLASLTRFGAAPTCATTTRPRCAGTPTAAWRP